MQTHLRKEQAVAGGHENMASRSAQAETEQRFCVTLDRRAPLSWSLNGSALQNAHHDPPPPHRVTSYGRAASFPFGHSCVKTRLSLCCDSEQIRMDLSQLACVYNIYQKKSATRNNFKFNTDGEIGASASSERNPTFVFGWMCHQCVLVGGSWLIKM